MERFHGGCHDCTMQDKNGLGYCVECMYFEANWDLPDLNDRHKAEKERKSTIKDKARSLAKSKKKPTLGFVQNLINKYTEKYEEYTSNKSLTKSERSVGLKYLSDELDEIKEQVELLKQ
jgi:hypothetical protein